jgi:tetrahydrodipicolinate N-succinyltransferase
MIARVTVGHILNIGGGAGIVGYVALSAADPVVPTQLSDPIGTALG